MRALRLGAFLAALLPAAAGAAEYGTANAVFLRMEQGGRAAGMGGAYISVADDAGSIWWNPAGLAAASVREVAATTSKFIEGITTHYAAFAVPISKQYGTLGGSFTYLDIPGIDGYDSSKQAVTQLTANAYMATVSWGRFFTEKISLGATGKLFGSRLDNEKGSGFAFDVGAQFRHEGFGAAFVAQHIGPDFKIGGDEEVLPRNFRGGLSYTYKGKLTGAADIERPIDGDFRLHIGSEWKATTAFTVRLGWQQTPYLGSTAGYTMGLGYVAILGGHGGWAGESTPWWEKRADDHDRPVRQEGTYAIFFDYAFTAMGDLADIHRFTMGAKF